MSDQAGTPEGGFWADATGEQAVDRYSTLVNMVDDGIYQLDAEGRFVAVNETIVSLTGYARKELLGEHASIILDDEDANRIQREIYRRYMDGDREGEPLELTAQLADGETLPCELELHLLAEEGTFQGTIGVVRDITDRKQTEQELHERERELRRKERRYEAIFEDPNILVGLLDPDGTVRDINQTAMEYVDADLEDVRGEPFWETPWWGEGDGVQPEVKEWVERAAAGEYVEFEADLTRADGEPYTISGYYRPVTDNDGEVVSIIVSDRDITERKQHERELELFRTLLNHSNDSVLVVDPETGRYLDVNDTACTRRGYSREEFLELRVTDLETEIPDHEAWRSFVEGLRAEGQLTFDGHHRRKDGTTYPVEVNASYVDLDQEYVLAIARDVTERREYERYLEDAKSRLEAATDAGAVGTWEWNIPEDEMVVGKTFARTFGIDPDVAREGVSLDQFIEAIHEDDRERVTAAIEEAVETGGDYEEEYRVWNADDDLRWVVARGHVECDDGEPIRFPGALTDITERKRAELELQQNNEQLETLFEVLPVGVVVAEADGQIVQANDIAHEIWGGDVFDVESVEEYEQYPVWDADSGERVQPDEMTLARVIHGEEVLDPDIYEIEAVDGERRVVRLEGMPVRNEHGEVTRGVATLTDITDRREAQRALEESERRYRTLVENFPNGAVGLFDEDLQYTAVGGQLFDRLDYGPEDRIGHRFTEIHTSDLVEELEPHFRAALDGEAGSFEIEYRGRHLHANTLPVRDADDEVYAGMIVIQDVTERREYERMLEVSNERLEQFAYAASHDLQEPLRMVSSYLRLLERRYADDLDEDAREFLDFAVDGADRMREMIDGLLEYSRVETRGDPFEVVDLDDVLAEVCDDLQVMIQESNAEITAEDLPRVEGDRGQLRQVFQNLLDNAIEYSGDEPPRIHIGAERDGDRWLVSVEDNGIGIDPEDTDRVFEVFQRLHTRDEHAGTGIGLALVERIIERHNGDVWVESSPGQGSTFSFALPVASDFET
ncbi:PAS domain-containing sensor histidine kinase [Halopelagius longus]|uniref:histidine kinase n=1 Tax=Halopelagius longus TaxID=1236180 RepID=A0A1H1FCM6_9EURY|nr:PAS domain S-box protein [Halopelagius longus]RDI70165.1 PAS domain S-box protein [Halopelagius longus]SDQ98712.1 PAS domain S-box-containing protein [Halopelagius longus]